MTGGGGRRGPWTWLAFLLLWLAAVAGVASWIEWGGVSRGREDPGVSLLRSPSFWIAGSDDPLPPTAQPDREAFLQADVAAPRAPSDGGGRVWLELASGDDGSIVAGGARSWTFVYEAGPLGLSVGGALLFYSPPFWGWSPAQTLDERAPGFTLVSTHAAGVELMVDTPQEHLVLIQIQGRGLAPGERVELVYGAGPGRATGDRFAERRSRFNFSVDGDGDGVSARVADPPSIEIRAGPPAQLLALLDSSARPGEDCRLTLAVLDAAGNTGVAAEDTFELQLPPGLRGPTSVQLPPESQGVMQVTLQARGAGVQRVLVRGRSGLEATSNPLQVSAEAPRILWADLHGHSGLSDGTGTPEDFYGYARDVAALDVAVLTDHDHWGFPFLDQSPALWAEIREQTQAFHEPGRFVTALGFEWTSWIHGHRHVLYFEDHGELLSSVDPAYASPRQLWDALAGREALTFAHHSAGGPVATNWTFAPDPVLEPLTEIVSVHGSSEAADSPARIYNWVEGNAARDALDQGYRLGFVGSGDSHDGHPGLTQLAAPPGRGGLAAVLSEERTRPAVLATLRRRATYATNGARIVLRATLDGREMGSSVPAADAHLAVFVAGTAVIERVALVRGGVLVEHVDGGGEEFEHDWPLVGLQAGEYVYVRVEQRDGGLAWSSPFFVE